LSLNYLIQQHLGFCTSASVKQQKTKATKTPRNFTVILNNDSEYLFCLINSLLIKLSLSSTNQFFQCTEESHLLQTGIQNLILTTQPVSAAFLI